MKKRYLFLALGLVIGGAVSFIVTKMTTPQVVEERVEIIDIDPLENNGKITGYKTPDKFTFAGEDVPLYRMDVKERFEKEILVNAFWHSNAIILIKRAHKWFPLIDSVLAANNIPKDFRYMAVAESGLDNVVSPSKAVGFWQFLEGTAGDFGLRVTEEVDERYDPLLATQAAANYLNQSYKNFGNWSLVAMSYNMGITATSRALERQRATNYYDLIVSEEPSRYLYRIMSIKNLLENPTQYGFEIRDADKYSLPKHKVVKITKTVEDWHELALSYGMNYNSLRLLNPWIRDFQLEVKPGQVYRLRILTHA